MDELIVYLTSQIAANCLDSIDERLLGARSRLNPTAIERVEGFLTNSSSVDRGQSPMSMEHFCRDYLDGSQMALMRIHFCGLLERPIHSSRSATRRRS